MATGSSSSTCTVHLLNLTQSQKADQNSSGAEGHRVTVEEKKLMNGNGSSLVVPRQFMDLGLAAKNGDADEHSESSSDERSRGERFGSLGDNVKAAGHSDDQRIGFDHEKKDFGRRIGREESPDQPSQSWGLNKVPRLSSPKEVGQTEATMRKFLFDALETLRTLNTEERRRCTAILLQKSNMATGSSSSTGTVFSIHWFNEQRFVF
ncbi:hypothetical protein TB2_036061 [Malus domestica]